MQAEPDAPAIPTRQRLLDAAARVFAREGLTGATTRAIADEAGVNEVTLFRHFQSKDRLIAAVIGENFGPQSAGAQLEIPPVTDDLRADLTALARCYAKHLSDHLPLVRTMIGESHHLHHCSHERSIFRGIFLPLKDAALTRIAAAQKTRQLRTDQRSDVLSDLFLAMIFTGVLRRAAIQAKIDYSADDYLEAAVNLFLTGAAPRPARGA
jgi:AcrR family transcriptional regulator